MPTQLRMSGLPDDYFHEPETDERWVYCEVCGGDGGGETVEGHDPNGPITRWHPCTACAGTGQIAVEMVPVELEGLDDEQ